MLNCNSATKRKGIQPAGADEGVERVRPPSEASLRSNSEGQRLVSGCGRVRSERASRFSVRTFLDSLGEMWVTAAGKGARCLPHI